MTTSDAGAAAMLERELQDTTDTRVHITAAVGDEPAVVLTISADLWSAMVCGGLDHIDETRRTIPAHDHTPHDQAPERIDQDHHH